MSKPISGDVVWLPTKKEIRLNIPKGKIKTLKTCPLCPTSYVCFFLYIYSKFGKLCIFGYHEPKIIRIG